MGIPSSFAQRGLTRKIRFIVGMSDWNLSRNNFVRLAPHAAIISLYTVPRGIIAQSEKVCPHSFFHQTRKKNEEGNNRETEKRELHFHISPPPQRGELGMNGAIYDADILRFYLPYEYCLPERGRELRFSMVNGISLLEAGIPPRAACCPDCDAARRRVFLVIEIGTKRRLRGKAIVNQVKAR